MSVHPTPGEVFLRLRVPFGGIVIRGAETDVTSVEVRPVNDEPASLQAAGAVREESRERERGGYDVTVEVPERRHRLLRFGREPEIFVEVRAPSGVTGLAYVASTEVQLPRLAAHDHIQIYCNPRGPVPNLGRPTQWPLFDSLAVDRRFEG